LFLSKADFFCRPVLCASLRSQMACVVDVQNSLESADFGQAAQLKWSNSERAERKVECNVVWEKPRGSGSSDGEPEQRPDFAVARYEKITPLNAALLDSYINGYQRTTTLFFGRIVSNPDDLPAFEEPLGYNMTYNAMATGHGNALHRHNSVEIFVALDAPFEIAYGSHGEFKAVLEPWDIVACPAEAIHSYKNIGQDGGQILTFLCGKPAICWANGVVAEARRNGALCDDTGILVSTPLTKKPELVVLTTPRTGTTLSTFEESASEVSPLKSVSEFSPVKKDMGSANSDEIDSDGSWGESRQASAETVPSETDLQESLQRRLSLMGKQTPELALKAGDLDPFIFRYAERAKRALKVTSSAGAMAVSWKDLQPGEGYTPEGEEDTLVIVLKGSVTCQGESYTCLDVLKQPTSLISGLEFSTLLVTRSDLPRNLDFFFDADIMGS